MESYKKKIQQSYISCLLRAKRKLETSCALSGRSPLRLLLDPTGSRAKKGEDKGNRTRVRRAIVAPNNRGQPRRIVETACRIQLQGQGNRRPDALS